MREASVGWAASTLAVAFAAALVGCSPEEPRGTVFPDVPTATPVPTEYHVEFAPGERELCDDPVIRERIEEAIDSSGAGSILARPQDLEGVVGADPRSQYEEWQQLSDEDRIFHLCMNGTH